MNRENIRNFCIISHVDHGKSTLADRFLELTGVKEKGTGEQILDQMDLEQERGITIKLQPVCMNYQLDGQNYLLNLIDTPGHMDFALEVERSLRAVEGVILLVDATAGVQAQTLSVLELAKQAGLVIIPVINKIDLPNARVKAVEKEIKQIISGKTDQPYKTSKKILKISAKQGTNVEGVLRSVIEQVPVPKKAGDYQDETLVQMGGAKVLVFDAFYDKYKGVIAFVKVVESQIKQDCEVGIFTPSLKRVDSLDPGLIGWLATGEEILEAWQEKIGWSAPQSRVFANLFAHQEENFEELKDGLQKMQLNDTALQIKPINSPALGRGFRVGFLGRLHLEIITERLRREFQLKIIVTSPSVDYQENKKGEIIREPWVELKIMSPQKYLGSIMDLLNQTRGKYQRTNYLGENHLLVVYEIPLLDIVSNFCDRLKGVSSGYASMSYRSIGQGPASLTKLKILLAGQAVESLERVVPQKDAYLIARKLAKKLKKLLPRQQFAVPIQVKSEGRIIARETMPALRKDVTGYLYGGDVSRKKKLLEKQKAGKKRLAKKGKINIPPEVFIKLIKN